MKKNCEFINLGEFEMTSPVMRVSDPCYERNVWCCGTVDHCKLGTWEAGVLKTDEGEWGTRCAVLAVRHKDTRDQVGKLQEIPIEFYCEIPAPEIAPIDDGLWRVVEDNLTYKQFEAIQFRNQGYANREIAELCGVGRKAIEKRFARIRKILSDYKEN